MFRWRNRRLEYRTGRSWVPSRTLRTCCRLGLHFLAEDFQRDGYFCECGKQHLPGEHISSNWPDVREAL